MIPDLPAYTAFFEAHADSFMGKLNAPCHHQLMWHSLWLATAEHWLLSDPLTSDRSMFPFLHGSFHVKSTQVTTWPPQNWMIFCDIVVPMEISIPVKFYCFIATRFLTADIQSCPKTRFLGTSCLRKSGISSALIEMQSSFYAHFKANKMPFPMTYYTDIFSTVTFSRSSDLIFDLIFLKIRYFNFLEKKFIVCI
jgi:hypothetical protein